MMTEYTAKDIIKLTPIEHVRHRPHMYVEHTSDPMPLLCEIIDNSLDEVLNIRGQHTIEVTLDYINETLTVRDTGRGIPYTKTNKGTPAIILVATELFAGGKFKKDVNSSYKISAGLHGVGLSVVNYLSDMMIVQSVRDGNKAVAVFKDGKHVSLDIKPMLNEDTRGTTVQFKVCSLIEKKMPNVDDVRSYLKTILLDPTVKRKVTIKLNVITNESTTTETITSDITDLDIFASCNDRLEYHMKNENTEEELYIVFTYDNVKEFKNIALVNLKPVNQGSHVTFVKGLILDKLEEIANQFCKIQLNRNDLQMGLKLFVSAKLIDVQFQGQSKYSLKTPVSTIKSVFSSEIQNFMSFLGKGKNFTFLKSVVQYIEENKRRDKHHKTLETFLNSDDNKSGYIRGIDVDNLYDCTAPSKENTELYIVEGASAGGTLLRIRDQKVHGVLLLRGKTVNSLYENKETEDLVKNREVVSILRAVGADAKGVKEDKIRYEKIILVADPDPDGCHINLLVLSIFARFLPDLLKKGYVYIAEVPLYMFYDKDKMIPVFDKSEAQKYMKANMKFTRYKGLGEMDANELDYAVVRKDTRKLIRLFCDDNDLQYLKDLMTTQATKKDVLSAKIED
jgi:DNA gyrase subunit B